jgi:hypothetical protein
MIDGAVIQLICGGAVTVDENGVERRHPRGYRLRFLLADED